MTDKKDKLESFKIGDTQQRGVSAPGRKSLSAEEKQAISEQYSLGFRRIETLLEDATPEEVSKRLQGLLDKLVALEEQSSTQRDKAVAQKALAAVERTADMMDYLFQVKAQMEAEAMQEG